jgi:hypothetical protein
MSPDQAKETIRAVIRQVQLESGSELPNLTDDFCPLRDLEGFDSLIGLVATDYVAAALGRDIPPDVNLFVAKRRRLTVAEAAKKLCDALGPSEAASVE